MLRLFVSAMLVLCTANIAAAGPAKRSLPVSVEIASRPTVGVVFDLGSTMRACASELEHRDDREFEHGTLHVTTGEFRGQPMVFVQDEHRNGAGDERAAATWIVRTFPKIQRLVAVSSSTAVVSDHLATLVPVAEVRYNGVVRTASVGIVVATVDNMNITAVEPGVQAVDQLIGHVAGVAAERGIPWQGWTFPCLTVDQVQQVRWDDYVDQFMNLSTLSEVRLATKHTDIALAYRRSSEVLGRQAATILPQLITN